MAELAPMMTAGELAATWRAYRAARDAGDRDGAIAARNLLVEVNLRLIPFTMKKYPRFARMYGSPEDAFQCGAVGLVRAVESFDQNGGSVFSTWAVYLIRHSVMNGIDGRCKVGRKASAIIYREAGIFYAQHGYKPNEAELLEITGLSPDHLRYGLAWARKQRTGSIDAPMGDPDDSDRILDLAADKATVDPCAFIRPQEAEVFLRRILAGLKPLYRKLLWLRFSAGWGEPALAQLCKTSRQRIQQITEKAVGMLQRVYTRAYRIWAGLDVPTREQAEIVSRWLNNG
jgi:RNA polymerase sigma factor (sigma-70 family)